MADLEVMCRSCHEAHHRVERATKPRRRRTNPAINRIALARYLTPEQRMILQQRFNMLWGQVYAALTLHKNKEVTNAALKMLGKKFAYSSRGNKRAYRKFNGSRHHLKILG